VMRSFLPSRIPMPATFSCGWGRLLRKEVDGIRWYAVRWAQCPMPSPPSTGITAPVM
jgi:hypothetical protein